ncbi:aKG-HExxH-type peptide beta-hydroxylase [Streptomyces chartreusis]|uniref:aKG-HExxH-type peptide beta-hydroxylase n=1 Tax=Streptomyces TaxID=1883 RepID=UPI00163B8E82|nr:HEXXH motif-containing putative peptide modification protein [Streptomyces sp. WAC 01325]WCH94223.1 HEXXH motif-containing putative peptide modification protein [Streptomyces moderatus]
MNPREFLAEIGGVPFVDAAFRPKALLTAVALVRRSADPEAHPSLAAYLDPENAKRIFDRHAVSKVEDVAWNELPAAEVAAVDGASQLVVGAMPDWRPLFAMPKRYRRMATSTSSTSVLVPQTIYLGPGAFRDEETLRETLIHEHAHIWLNFIAEVYDLQVPDAPNDYVLPSGTDGKTYRGVMFAAHFAAAAAWALSRRRAGGEGGLDERLQYLTRYLEGCLVEMDRRPHGSATGDLVKDALAQRLDGLLKEPAHPAETR